MERQHGPIWCILLPFQPCASQQAAAVVHHYPYPNIQNHSVPMLIVFFLLSIEPDAAKEVAAERREARRSYEIIVIHYALIIQLGNASTTTPYRDVTHPPPSLYPSVSLGETSSISRECLHLALSPAFSMLKNGKCPKMTAPCSLSAFTSRGFIPRDMYFAFHDFFDAKNCTGLR